jgi:uncharacterized delta-60 repeat protein
MTVEFALARWNPDGSTDTTFGNNGLVTTGFPGLNPTGHVGESETNTFQPAQASGGETDRFQMAQAIAVSGDTIVAAGLAESELAVARYKVDGTLDESFGYNGRLRLHYPKLGRYVNLEAHGVTLDRQGNITLVGTAYFVPDAPSYRLIIARIDNMGQLVRTFGDQGMIAETWGQNLLGVFGESILLDPQNRVVVGGSVGGLYTRGELAVARYNADGQRDNSFSSDGRVRTALAHLSGSVYALAIDANERILAAGADSTGRFVLARYKSDGSLDQSFNGGTVFTDFSSNHAGGGAYAVIPSVSNVGSYLVAGAKTLDGATKTALACYNSDGSLSSGFGSNGSVVTDHFFGGGAVAMATGWAGNFIVAVDGYPNFEVVQFDRYGDVDRSFGLHQSGKAIAAFPSRRATARAMAIDPYRRIIVAGSVETLPTNPTIRLYLPERGRANFPRIRPRVAGIPSSSKPVAKLMWR